MPAPATRPPRGGSARRRAAPPPRPARGDRRGRPPPGCDGIAARPACAPRTRPMWRMRLGGRAAAPNAAGSSMPRRSRRAPGGRRGAAASSTAAHLAGRHRHVEERGRVAAERRHGGAGGVAGGDVIGVPVEAVFAERHHHVRPAFDDRRVDVPLQHAGWQPGQHAVGVIAKHHLGEAERGRRAASSSRARVAPRSSTCAPTRLAARQAQQRHARPSGGAPCEQPAGRQRLVVGMGEDRQQRTALEIA